MRRAYSLLHVKEFSEESRTISGIASTPTPDRMDDVLEPHGASFTLPLPLLWQHNAREPIGHVTDARVTDDGIAITAQLVKVDQPGALQDRLNDAWLSIKSGLVRGLSVGFAPIEFSEIKGSFGYRYLKWLWLELSAVTIPANQDASIQLIKSLDSQARAALGSRAAVDPRHSSGAAETGRVVRRTTQDPAMKKSLTDQIKAFEATRQAKSERMQAIMDEAAEHDTTLDERQQQEYDDLAEDVKTVDAHLRRLHELETMNKALAKPAPASVGVADASRDRNGTPVLTVKMNRPAEMEFARYTICNVLGKGDPARALAIAQSRYPDETRIHEVLKAAVAAGTTSDPTWAGSLVYYQNLVSEFIEFLRPATIIGKFGTGAIPSLRRVPFNVRITGQTSGGSGYWVGEGAPKPLTKFDFTAIPLRWAKVAAITVIADELVRFSSPSAEALVRDALRDALVARLDTDFIDPSKAAVANVSPASITHGLTALTPSGTDLTAVHTDVKAIFAPFIAANITPANGVWIMSANVALGLSLMTTGIGEPVFPTINMLGGTWMGLPVIVSQYAALAGSPINNLVILVNASDIFLADDGMVTIDASQEASLQMADSPTNSVASGSPLAPVPTSVVSLWQTNSTGLRAERFINWEKRRAAAAAYFEHVAWGT